MPSSYLNIITYSSHKLLQLYIKNAHELCYIQHKNKERNFKT